MKSKNWFLKRARKMFSDPLFYAFILLCFYGLVIYPGCKFDKSGLGGVGVAYSITPPPDGCVDQYYYYDLNSYYGIYGFSPFPQYQLTAGSLPQGLDPDVNSGILSGVPRVTGVFSFEIDVVDAASEVLASGSFTININDFSIVTSFLPLICAGTTYSAIIDICGGIPPFTWETIDWDPSVLPLNFTVPGPANSRQNTLTGTPVTPGDYTLKIRVTDSRGDAFRIEKEFTLEVTDEITILTPRHLPTRVVNEPFNQPLEACGGVVPYIWEEVASWPSFLALDSNSGVISGTPNAAGAYFLKVKLSSEGGGSSTEKYFSLTVAASPLVVTAINLTGFYECVVYNNNSNMNLSGMVSGGLGVPFWQLAAGETLPPELSLSTGGVLTGRATTPGSFEFLVNVYDGTTDPLNPPYGEVSVEVLAEPPYIGLEIERAYQWPPDPDHLNYQDPDEGIDLDVNRGVKFDFQITDSNWETTWDSMAPTPQDPDERREVYLKIEGLCGVEIRAEDIDKRNTDGVNDPGEEHVARFALWDLNHGFVGLINEAVRSELESPFTFRIWLVVPEDMNPEYVSGRSEEIEVVDEP
jgi:hypothetical protein